MLHVSGELSVLSRNSDYFEDKKGRGFVINEETALPVLACRGCRVALFFSVSAKCHAKVSPG